MLPFIVTTIVRVMIKQIVNIAAFFSFLLPSIVHANVLLTVIAPKSGEYKIWGEELIRGVQIAVDEKNNQGGVNGKKLVLMSVDDSCSANLSVSAAQMLALGEEKPALVIGPYCSDSSQKVSTIYAKAKIFQIIPTTLRDRDFGGKQVTPVKMSDFKETAAPDLFSFYNNRYAGQKTALVFESDSENIVKSAHAAADEFRRHGKASLLRKYNFDDYSGNLQEMAAKIVDDGIDVAIIWGTPKKIAKMIRNLARIKPQMVIITGKYMAGEDFVEYALEYLDNVYFMALPPAEEYPEMAETIVNLRLKGIEVSGLGVYGYASVQMWAELVEKSNSFSYDKLVRQLQKGKLKSTWGKTFTNNGAAKNPLHYQFYQYRHGEYVESD